jgi:HEAT repeat protein
MSTVWLIVIVLIVIGVAIAGVLGTILTNGMIQARRLRYEPLVSEAHRAVVAALIGGEREAAVALEALKALPSSMTLALILDLAPSVSGSSQSALIGLGEGLGLVRRAKRGLASIRWPTRLYSARVLTAFAIEDSRMVLMLSDRSAEVRAQAAAWCVVKPTPEAIETLVNKLNDPDGLCRFAVQDSLVRIGLPAIEPMVRRLDTAPPEIVDRLLEIAAASGDARFFSRSLNLTRSESPGTRARAASVLARIGDPSAGATLESMLFDTSDRVILASLSALASISYWSACPAVAHLLDHPSWEVRNQAGLTLVALGAPGEIFLLTASSGAGLAAEMAERILQLRSFDSHSYESHSFRAEMEMA